MIRDLGTDFRAGSFAKILMIGLDATIFLKCLHMLRWMFLCISLLVAIPAVFVNYQINTSAVSIFGSRQEVSDLDNTNRPMNATELDLLIFTAANASGNAMSAHVIFECAATCIVVLFRTCPHPGLS
jgi:hypothetical protein